MTSRIQSGQPGIRHEMEKISARHHQEADGGCQAFADIQSE
jgi:hypothetical protein